VNRRTAAVLSPVLLSVLLSAGPAHAETQNPGLIDGGDAASPIGVGTAIVLYVVLPLMLILLVAALVWLPGMVRGSRYRPQRGWTAPPLWFAGPIDPVAAVQSAEVGTTVRGGARGSW
jgi:hypothetical protein